MRNRALYFLFSLAVFLSVSSFVFAAGISGPSSSTLCQCATSQQKFSVCADVAGTYSVNVEGAWKDWLHVAPASVNLLAGSCTDVFLYATPGCFADSGTYNYSINLSGPISQKFLYSLFVNQCHSFDFNVSLAGISSLPCENNSFLFSLKNTGSFTDEFVFSQKGLPDGWAAYPQGKVVLSPGGSYFGKLDVVSSCSADANTFPFSFIVSNTRTNSSFAKSLAFSVQKPTPFSLGNLFSDNNFYAEKSCEEFDKNISFVVRSLLGKADTVSLALFDLNHVPLGKEIMYFDRSFVVIDSNTTANVNLLIKKHAAGTVKGYIVADSKTYGRSFEVPFSVDFENCYDFDLSRDSNSTGACFAKSVQGVRVTNTGSQVLDVNVEIRVDNNVIDSKSVSVGKNDFKVVQFAVVPLEPSESKISVVVESPFLRKDLNYSFGFENCFAAEIQADPIGACVGADINQAILISNTGSRAQSFAVSVDSNWLGIYPKKADINFGSSKSFVLAGKVLAAPPANLAISAVSNNMAVKKSVAINLLGVDECNSFEVFSPSAPVLLVSCSGSLIDVNIKNTGYFDENISVKILSPAWVSVAKNASFLRKGETGSVFLYCSPDSNTAGIVRAVILFSNDKNVSKQITIDLNVSPLPAFVLPGQVDINGGWKDNNAQIKYFVMSVTVRNDSNSGFAVNNVSLGGFNSFADFNKGVFLSPGEGMTIRLRVLPDVNGPVPDKNVVFIVETSAGVFSKFVALTPNQDQVVSVTGFFSAYLGPLLGLLLFILLVLVLLALRGLLSKKKSKYAEVDNEEGEKSGTIYASPEEIRASVKKEIKKKKKK